jgi:hypothetical protein
MPSRRLNRILWVTVIVLAVFFALRAQDTLELAMSSIGKLDVRSEPGSGQIYLRWRGKIEAPMAQRIAEELGKRGGSSISTVVLSLSSPGGSLDHGADVIALLGRIRDTYRLETVVEGRGICASMCVPVYLQGDVRRSAPSARFMFHEVSFRESLSEEKIAVPEKAVGSATDRFFAKYFLAYGVPQDWVSGVRAAIAGGTDVWKTGRELLDERAGIVQRLE